METINNLEEVKQLLAKPYSGIMIGEKKYSFGDDGLNLTPEMRRAVVALALLGQLNGDNFVKIKDLSDYLGMKIDAFGFPQAAYKMIKRLTERVDKKSQGLVVYEEGFGYKLKTEGPGQISLIDKSGELIKIEAKTPGLGGESGSQDPYEGTYSYANPFEKPGIRK
jgi:hypothetical protein